MRSHVLLGYDALRKIPNIAPEILEGTAQHHEMHDGLGYPYGLKGSAIGLFGRIISICDVYDALSSRRVYKAALCPSHVPAKQVPDAHLAKGGRKNTSAQFCLPDRLLP